MLIPGRTTITVPEGHHVDVHPPIGPMPGPAGMIPDPATQGALAAMNSALPATAGGTGPVETKPAAKKKPVTREAEPAKKGKTKDKGAKGKKD
jgi:hypothetical protein